MPIYEYKCADCGVHLEKLQKTSDEPLTKCESCGGKLEKQWSLSGFQFKGEGWYVTDYAAKKADGKTSESESSESGESKKSDGGSTESTETASKEKPEKKAEPKKEKTTTSEKSD